MKYFAVLIGLIIAFASVQARAQATPDDQYVAIYTLIEQADSLQASGHPRQALQQYTQATQQLQQFQKVFPHWYPSVVNYRLNYLKQKTDALTAKLPAPPTTTNAPPSAVNKSSEPSPAETDVESSSGISDADSLRALVKNLQAQNATLQAKLREALSVQPAASDEHELAMAQQQVQSLLKENELLRSTLDNAKKTKPASNAQELQAALDNARQNLNEQTARADKLARENQKLKSPPKSSGASQDELTKLRTQISRLQSEIKLQSLEKMALEKRLQQSEPPSSKTIRTNEEINAAATSGISTEMTASEISKTGAGAEAKSVSSESLKKLVAEAQNYFSAQEYDKAESAYRQILQRAPNDAPALAVYGYLQFRNNKYDDALDSLSRAAELDPKNPQIQNYLGVTLSHKGRQLDAEKALLKAIQLNPDYAAARNNLAVVYINENPPKIALARLQYQKALDAGQPRNADLEKSLAEKGAPVAEE